MIGAILISLVILLLLVILIWFVCSSINNKDWPLDHIDVPIEGKTMTTDVGSRPGSKREQETGV